MVLRLESKMLARIKQKSNSILQRIIGDFRESAWLREKTESFSSISPWLDFIDEHIVLMRDGAGVAVFKIRGIDHEVDEYLVAVAKCNRQSPKYSL